MTLRDLIEFAKKWEKETGVCILDYDLIDEWGKTMEDLSVADTTQTIQIFNDEPESTYVEIFPGTKNALEAL